MNSQHPGYGNQAAHGNQPVHTNQPPYVVQPSYVNKNSYVNQEVISVLKRKKKSRFIWGGIFTAFMACGIVFAIIDYEGRFRKNLMAYIIMIIPFLILLYFGIKHSKTIANIYRYNSIFANDSDGFVTIQELTRQTGKNSNVILKELEKLFRMNAFYGCTLYQQGNPGVVLGDAFNGEAGTGFIVVKCSSCGGNNRARAGTHAVCEYCGSSFLAQ